MDAPTMNENPLFVVVVGAGIAGLATATALSRKGHKVLVLESRPELSEFGASIGVLSNGVRCLKQWGLEAVFEEVVTKNKFLEVRNGITNKVLGHSPHNEKRWGAISYGEEIWNINRRDYQHALAKAAISNGAQIKFDVTIAGIDVEKCSVQTVDGRDINADVIIGADGMRSAVRKSIPALSDVEPTALHEEAFRCTVPKEKMQANPILRDLLTSGNEMVWTAPGRYVLSWPLPPNRPYDVVTCVQRESSVPPGRWGLKADVEEARKDFQDFCPQVKELLDLLDGCVKWRLAELPPLETCKSENGKVVLVGDAFHAMIPHSASGGNSAIEDAAAISECLDWAARNGRDVAEATQAFQDLRMDRVRRMQTASHEGYSFLAAKGDFLPIRDQGLRMATKHYDEELALPEEVRRAKSKMQPDINARFPTEPYLQWLFNYDAIAVAKQHLSRLGGL